MAENPKAPDPPPWGANDEDTKRYWRRLDAKFAGLNTSMPSSPAAPAEPAASPAAPSDSPVSPAAPSEPPAPPRPVAPASGLIAEAFAALLALEDGQPGATPVRLTTGDGHAPTPPAAAPPAAAPVITDAVIEDIVRRVVERLGPDAVRAVVVDVVSDVSERLVKEEIERIRNQHA
jgi:hypothetical protein